jgi:hypothetical protein
MRQILRAGLRLGAVGLAVNEIRGAIVAVPVLIGMWRSGGEAMAIWLGFCALGGIALSVIVPIVALRWAERKLDAAHED